MWYMIIIIIYKMIYDLINSYERRKLTKWRGETASTQVSHLQKVELQQTNQDILGKYLSCFASRIQLWAIDLQGEGIVTPLPLINNSYEAYILVTLYFCTFLEVKLPTSFLLCQNQQVISVSYVPEKKVIWSKSRTLEEIYLTQIRMQYLTKSAGQVTGNWMMWISDSPVYEASTFRLGLEMDHSPRGVLKAAFPDAYQWLIPWLEPSSCDIETTLPLLQDSPSAKTSYKQ